MEQRLFEILRQHFAVHGYWTLALALLLENMGIPVPGESALLFASYLAFSEHRLHLPYIIVTGVVAATVGDNLGYLLGHHGGRPLLERYKHFFHIPEKQIARGERLFSCYGSLTVFFARFVFGMRIIAGPMAGVLRMPWREFVVFNLLGAALWVSVISSIGYLFGRHWDALVRAVSHFDIVIVIVVVLAIALAWWRSRR